MKVPERYWDVRLDQVDDTPVFNKERQEEVPGPREICLKYLLSLEEMRAEGMGLLLWGANGTGKSSAAVVVGKEFRRRGYTVLFLECADLKRLRINDELFDDEETYWERAASVDFLILDDLGKGVADSTGFGVTLVDELLRYRNARKLVTFLTANVDPREFESDLKLKRSTMSTLKECVYPVEVRGTDKRDGFRPVQELLIG
jgi:DNA replication protein DnaC